jgi:hypothetical protein
MHQLYLLHLAPLFLCSRNLEGFGGPKISRRIFARQISQLRLSMIADPGCVPLIIQRKNSGG